MQSDIMTLFDPLIKINVLFICLLFCACTKRDISTEIIVAAEIQPMLDEFINEAQKRGYIVDFSDTGLIMEFGETPSGASAVCLGLGNAHDGRHHMVFDKSQWDNRSFDENASRVYHELGHCELSRPHNNELLDNGMWKTIMRGSPLLLDEILIARAFYGFRKEYYIDELFNRETPSPWWEKQNFDVDEISDLQKETILDSILNSNTLIELDANLNSYQISLNIIFNDPNQDFNLHWGTETDGAFFTVIPNLKIISIGIIESGHAYILHNAVHDEIDFTTSNSFILRAHEDYIKIFTNDTFEFFMDPLNTEFKTLDLNVDASVQANILLEKFI